MAEVPIVRRRHRSRLGIPPQERYDRIEVTIDTHSLEVERLEQTEMLGLRSLTVGSADGLTVLRALPFGVLLPFTVRAFKGKKIVEEISGQGYVSHSYMDFGDFDNWAQECIDIHVETFG